MGEDLGGSDADSAADTHGDAAGGEALADGGGEQVDLELDAEHGQALGHSCEAGVAAGRVGDGGDCPGMDEAVLLLDRLGPWEFDVHLAIGDADEPRTEGGKEALTLEGVGDAVVEGVEG